MSVEVFD